MSKTQTRETREIEVYEFEQRGLRSGWGPSSNIHTWAHRDGSKACPPEEVQLPKGCQWYSNWKPKPTTKCMDGWEYASAMNRFDAAGRVPRDHKHTDRFRRRRWIRNIGLAESKTSNAGSSSSSSSSSQNNSTVTSSANGGNWESQVNVSVQGLGENIENTAQATRVIGELLRRLQRLGMGISKLSKNRELLARPEVWGDVNARADASCDNLQLALDRTSAALGGMDSAAARKLQKRDLASLQTLLDKIRQQSEEMKQLQKRYLEQRARDSGGRAHSGGRANSGGQGQAHRAGEGGGGSSRSKAYSKAHPPSSSSSSNNNNNNGGNGVYAEEGTYVPRRAVEQQVLSGLVAQDELEVNDYILAERDAQITEVHENMKELNHLFKVLGSHVAEQGEMLDKVETNTGTAHTNTKDGLQQVQRAAEHQPGCVVM